MAPQSTKSPTLSTTFQAACPPAPKENQKDDTSENHSAPELTEKLCQRFDGLCPDDISIGFMPKLADNLSIIARGKAVQVSPKDYGSHLKYHLELSQNAHKYTSNTHKYTSYEAIILAHLIEFAKQKHQNRPNGDDYNVIVDQFFGKRTPEMTRDNACNIRGSFAIAEWMLLNPHCVMDKNMNFRQPSLRLVNVPD